MLAKIREEWEKWTTLTPSNTLYDRTLLWLYFSLLAIGLVMVTSASIPVSTRLFDDPFSFAKRELLYIGMSLFILICLIQIPCRFWEKYSLYLFGFTLIALIAVLAIGTSVNGSKRWIGLGPINFQPSELAKFAFICYFASFYVRQFKAMRTKAMSFFRPFLILAIFGGLIFAQPDMGSVVVLFVITFGMLFIMGARIGQFIILALLGGSLGTIFVLISEYRMKRVTSFMDPFADAYGDGFQLSNSQMAFGQGEIFGQGLGNAVQKLEYLPEAHTDFITAVIGEEFGLIGILFIGFLLFALILRAIKISKESLILGDRFRGFFAFGMATWLSMQGFVSLGIASGLLPTKGLTFPFVSYGGSSMIMLSVGMAVLIRIDYENRLAQLGQARAKVN